MGLIVIINRRGGETSKGKEIDKLEVDICTICLNSLLRSHFH